jgi:sec-independent protein translocase protein TatB
VFDIGWSEMAIIMLVALVVIGPRDLPRLARSLGQWVAKGRAMAREFQRSIEDLAREAELDDVKREIEKVGRTNIRKSIEKTIDPTGELGKAFNPTSIESSNSKTPAKLATTTANGAAKEPAAKPDLSAEPEAATQPTTTSKPKPAARPKTPAKPKTPAQPKAATKPKARAKPKTATGTAPKPAPSETAEAETTAEPR